MTELNPIQRSIIRERLVLEDFIHYVDSSFTGDSKIADDLVRDILMGDDAALDKLARELGITKAKDKQKLRKKSGLARALDKKIAASPKMSSVYNKLRPRLTDPDSVGDLRAVVKDLKTEPSLNEKQKRIVRERLVLEDFIHYVDSSFTGDSKIADDLVRDILMGDDAALDKLAKKLGITKAKDKQKLRRKSGLAKELNKSIGANHMLAEYYNKLAAKLTVKDGNVDLRTVLCQLNTSEGFCPAISKVDPGKVPQGTTDKTITVTGVNLPKNPKINMGEKIEVKNVARTNDKEIKVTISVKKDAAIGPRDIKISTKAGWLEAAGKIEIAAALPPNCGDKIDNDNDGLVDAADPDCKPGGKGEIAATVDTKLPGCNDGIDNDKDGKIDGKDEDCLVGASGEIKKKAKAFSLAGTKPSTKMQIAAYWLQKKLKLEVPVSFGGRGIVNGKLTDLPYNNRAAAETDPNISAGVKVDPLVLGNKKDGALVSHDMLELRTPARFGYTHFLQDEPSLLLEAAAGANLKLKLSDWASPEAYAGYTFNYSDYGYPNKWFFSGMNHQLSAGAAVTHNARIWTSKFPFTARLFVESNNSWFNWDKETQGFPFEGSDHALKIGVEGKLPFTSLKDHWAVPDLTLKVAGIPWGTHEVPEVILPGLSSSSREAMTGLEVEGRVEWNNLKPYKPYLLGGYRRLDLEGWPSVSEAFWGAGVTSPEAGNFALNGRIRWNVTPYYNDNVPSQVLLSWRPPETWLDGRLSGITLNAGFRMYEDSTGKNPAAVGAVNFELFRIIFGKAPDKIVRAQP